MGFVLRMVGREARASWRRLVFFFVCVAVGVGAIVALRSVIQSVRTGIVAEARSLNAADVTSRVRAPGRPSCDARSRNDCGPRARRSSREAIETATMARPADASKVLVRAVELQGVETAFPLYGRVELDGDQRYAHELLRGQGALVRPELLTQLDVKVGDQIVIGDLPFTIRGVVLSEPGRRLGFFSFGPRVLIDLADLERTGLLAFGSRARRDVDGEGTACRRRSDRAGASTASSRSSSSRPAPSAAPRTDRTDLRSRGELPQPGRLHHRDPRRDRRVERDARVRAAEAPRDRGAEVPRRVHAAGPGGLRRAGAGARRRWAACWAC